MHTASVVLRHIVSIVAGLIVAVSPAMAQTPSVGPNVNMVTGTTWPAGDPFLTKQNEPSLAVSSRNPMHLLGGANDYRLTNVDAVPITGESDAGDAWVTVFKSTDGGATWRASLMKGCPQPIPQCGSASGPNPNTIKASNAEYAADPTISSGPYGTYFYSFIAGRRDSPAGGVTAIQRFVDLNNEVKSGDDPFVEDPPIPSIIDTGTQGQFLDKSWNKADVPGRPWNGTTTCLIQGYSQPVPAFNVYISYSNFVGQAGTNPHPQILVARSTDCGVSYGKAVKVSQSIQTNQGSTMVIDPPTGTLYVLWRAVADPTNGTLDGIYMNKSSDGGNSWGNATLVSNILPFDQGDATGVSFRTRSFPSATISVDSTGKSRLHVAWSQRKAPLSTCLDANGNVIFDVTKNCDARIRLGTYDIAAGTWAFSWVDDWNVDLYNQANPGRGHQFMPALNSVNGKIAAVWYDQRYDATIGRMVCTNSQCKSMLDFDEIRVPTENFVAGHREFVFTPFLADAPVSFIPANPPVNDSKGNPVLVPDPTTGLARRHTVDTFGALADAANMPVFTSSRISQYLLGNLKGTPEHLDTDACGPKGVCAEAQQQNPVNVPIAAGGTRAFIGDYLEVAAQTIVPTGNANVPYGFNCGKTISNAKGPVCFNAAGDALQPVKSQPVFHAAWTDNRDVVRPWDGDWTHQTPIHVIVTSADGSTASISNNLSCAPGQDGSRNSNVYTAAFSGGSRGLINANTKKLDPAKPRGFVVGVQNFVAPNLPDTGYRAYRLTILPTSATASFDRFAAPPPPPALTTVTTLYVPPQSSSWRTVWALSSTPAAAITVDISLIVDSAGQPITIPVKVSDLSQYAFQPVSQLGLNADPLATLNLNADSNTTDLATNTLNNSTLNNSTLSNNTLNNSTLNNLTLSNLTLSNLTLSNNTLNNVDPETITLNNNTLNNNTLNNLTLSNATLNNATLNNLTLSNATLNNLTLSNLTLSNADLTNLALNNLTLNNSTLSNTEIADTALTNNAVTSDALTNSYPADTTYTVANAGNTDTTIDVKTLLRGQKVPDGYTMQLVLRKVVLVPNAVGRCYIGLLQQSAQVANLSTPTAAVDDATLGQFINDATAATLPLSAGEKAQLTMRVARKDDPGGVLAAEVGRYGDRFVAIGQAGTATSIPLIIKTLSLPSVIVHKTASLPVISFGGNGSTINWTLQAPPWITLSASTGTTVSLIVNKPPDVGTFLITLKITDSSAPPGPDLFCRYKPDPQGPFVGAIGCDSENFQLVVTK